MQVDHSEAEPQGYGVEQLEFIRKGAETKRYHTVATLQTQNIADHSFHVAMLCSWLAGQGMPGISVPLLMAALTHDLAEHKMGDLPAPVKRSLADVVSARCYVDGVEELPLTQPFRQYWDSLEQYKLQGVGLEWESQLTPQELRWLKLADAADGCFYCIRERSLGNKTIAWVFNNFRDYVRKIVLGEAETSAARQYEFDLVDYIDEKWEEACG